jgi:septum formation protein
MINGYKCILGSGSPRRIELLRQIGILDEVVVSSIDESWPEGIQTNKVAEYVAVKKAEALNSRLYPGVLLITADTTVINGQEILNKPLHEQEALEMLHSLCGKTHEVVTGVCITTSDCTISFTERTRVTVSNPDEKFLRQYVKSGSPMDKAGGYGIQDVFGIVAVERIEGCFYNVIGLPVSKLLNTIYTRFPGVD